MWAGVPATSTPKVHKGVMPHAPGDPPCAPNLPIGDWSIIQYLNFAIFSAY